MQERGEIADLDEQIEQLMNRQKLTELQVKQLCSKVSSFSLSPVLGLESVGSYFYKESGLISDFPCLWSIFTDNIN